MTVSFVPYPITPEKIDEQILKPSASFKREVIKALGAIIFFVIAYIILVVCALGLAILCAIGGIGLIILKPMSITIMLGLGLAGLGLLVVFFLFKFLFKSHKVDRSGLIEIKESDQPRLFEFVRRLSKETQTPFPKKIYLSQDVNASVFYNSGFWSMFLPVRKNLMIGLGLVNSVTTSEFKAIVAHEFGHFSQRSMKLGSYVYNMNQIIFNLLFENESYENAIERWGNMSGYFAIFAALTIRIVKGIQWILRQLYGIVNKQYMSLSRQMEFHADTVAASVSGGNHLITSLRRMEVAEITLNNILNFYSEHIKDGLKPDNIYLQHQEAMKEFSKANRLPFENGLPQVDANSFARFNRSRVTVKDQWASHPSTDDRENHLRSLNIETEPEKQSAWMIFDSPKEVQKQFTEKIFQEVTYSVPVQILNEAAFIQRYSDSLKQYQLPEIYRGFFDARNITITDLRNIETRISIEGLSLDDIFSEEVIALPHRKNGINNDLQTLEAISNGTYAVKNFEFCGQKYPAKNASELHSQLEEELKQVDHELAQTDEKVIAWFLKKMNESNREKTREKYSELFLAENEIETQMKVYGNMQSRLFPLYQTMKFKQIEYAVAQLKEEEIEFKKLLERLVYNPSNSQFMKKEQKERAEEYLSKTWEYFVDQTYIQSSLERLNDCLYLFYIISSEKLFHLKSELLKTQLELIENE